MANAANLFPREKTLMAGSFATVTVAGDELATISVEWEAPQDGEHPAELVTQPRVQWASNGRLPAPGDPAILMLDGEGGPWALVFATGALIGA